MESAELSLVFLCFIKIASSSAPTNCKDGRFYIREDPTSCTHFYKCDNGNPVRFLCPDRLYFSTETHNCDWPYNVKCDVNTGQREGQQSSATSNNKNGQNNDNYKNNGGQYKDNKNNAGQYNSNNKYNGGHGTSNNNGGQNRHNNNPDGNNNNNNSPEKGDVVLAVQLSYAQDPAVGPSIVEPPGGFEDRQRPTVDDLYFTRNNPY